MIKNLLPEDTRLAEFIGSISLIFMGIFLGSHVIVNMELLFIQRTEFWHVLFIMLGFTQFLSLVFYPQLELLRCIMSLFTGATLIWLSFLSLVNIMEISDVVSFCVGIANLYSFVINSLQVRKIWAN